MTPPPSSLPRRTSRALPRPLLVATILALALAAPSLASAVGGVLEGSGVATTFTIYGEGSSVSTGQRQWTLVCTDCLVKMSLTSLDGVTFANADLQPNGPGHYELREFAGTIVEKVNGPYDVSVTSVGYGEVIRSA